MELKVQPHPVIADLLGAIELGAPEDVDVVVCELNGLIDGSYSYCWNHNVTEAAGRGRCRECGHGWDSDEQLCDEDFAVAMSLWPDQAVRAPHASHVFVCPACAHDL
jgi:hypothetical protein